MSFLLADEKPISAVLGFEYGNRLYYFRPAFDPAYAKYGAGHVHLFHLLEESFSRRLAEVDFLNGEDPYKKVWARGQRRVATYQITKSDLVGRLYWALFRAARKLHRAHAGS